VEIAEATEYLASSTGASNGDMMKGLTLTVPPRAAPTPPPVPPVPTMTVAAPSPGYSPAPTSVPAPPAAGMGAVPNAGATPDAGEAASVPKKKKGFFGLFKGKKKVEETAPAEVEAGSVEGAATDSPETEGKKYGGLVTSIGDKNRSTGQAMGAEAAGMAPVAPATGEVGASAMPPAYTEAVVEPEVKESSRKFLGLFSMGGGKSKDDDGAGNGSAGKEKKGLFGFFKGGSKKGAEEEEALPVVSEVAVVEPLQAGAAPGQLTAAEQAFLKEAGIEGLPLSAPAPMAPVATAPGYGGAPGGINLALPPQPSEVPAGFSPAVSAPPVEETSDDGEEGMERLRMMKRVPKGKPKIKVLF
jgi:hypothetical protein